MPRLTITVSQDDVARIAQANQQVTLVQPVTQMTETSPTADALAVPVASLAVAWQVFAPWPSNTVVWSDDYTPFASPSSLATGTVIQIASAAQQPADPGSTATLADNVFSYAEGQGEGYDVANADGQDLLLGLSVAATVNNGTAAPFPICAAAVLPGEAASFVPVGAVSVLLSSCTAGGTLLPFQAGWCTVPLTGDAQATVAFDPRTSGFQITTGE